jgi:hypothetical protein
MVEMIIPDRPDLKVIRPRILTVSFSALRFATGNDSKPEQLKPDVDFYVQDFEALAVAGAAQNLLLTGQPLPTVAHIASNPATPTEVGNRAIFEQNVQIKMSEGGTAWFTDYTPIDHLRSKPGRPSVLRGMILSARSEVNVLARVVTADAALQNFLVNLQLSLVGYDVQKR